VQIALIEVAAHSDEHTGHQRGKRVSLNSLRRSLASATSMLLLSVGLVVGGAGPVLAANVACGQTITVSTVLDGDVGPCATGITIGASNVTFDLNGHTITGNPGPGEGPGISLENRNHSRSHAACGGIHGSPLKRRVRASRAPTSFLRVVDR
jgi:hypothetical protein